jgi:ribosomal protein S18 acetylase RimI-like enzyme
MAACESMKIRDAASGDFQGWFKLWDEYCDRSKVTLPESVTRRTWERIVDPSEPMGCLVAEKDGEGLLGFCNYVLHPNTFSAKWCCYMEDLYVSPAARRQGIATALVQALIAKGRAEGWCRVYWITEDDNAAAQAMYDRLGTRTGHVRYKVALSEDS